MNIKKNIEKNQIDIFKLMDIEFNSYKTKYISDKDIVYEINLTNNNIKYHIVINYNWFLNTSSIQIYFKNEIKTQKIDCYNLDDLNNFVIQYVLKTINKN